MVSNFGTMIQSVAASWMMASIDRSAEMVALVQACVTLPIMLLSLPAGAVADSFDRRRVMIIAQLFMILASLGLAAFAWSGLVTPWILLAFTFLLGCGTALNGPAWQASVGDMVPRPELAGAVALNSMGFNVARSVGPALGGAIVAGAGAAAAFAINAASFMPLIAVLAHWRAPGTKDDLPRERMGSAMAAGIRYVAMSPVIGRVLLRGLIFGFGASAINSLMPLIARDLIAGGPLTYGLLLGAFGMGAVAGALSSARLRQALSSEGIVRWSCAVFAASAFLAGPSHSLPATMALLFAAGGAWVLALSTFNVTVQLHSPRWVVARALSLYQVAAFGGMAAGSWLWGMTADGHGVPIALSASAIILLLCGALGAHSPLAPTGELDLSPLRSWRAPEPAIAVDSRTGPVVITVEYRIEPGDRREFLAAMAERQRMRRRDGARHWRLLRDISDSEIWIERYNLPTWADYIRHNNRITHEDEPAHDRVRSLHRGPSPPLVRRMLERETRPAPAGLEPAARDEREPLTDPSRAT
ncbi:MAG: transporter [Alphaproteobacteria bacterium]|nr:transporter [Alphaproteobacteria bacterium]